MTTLLAPLAGWCAPLSEIPDPVFAQAMLGDGVAIDPLSREMRAPCDGEVISIAAARHAVALRSASGAEILVHVGVDTVGLAGEGFELHVRNGDRVRAGDLLLSFDIDAVARRAPSLMTPVIITNGERFRVTRARVHREVKHGDVLFELEEIGAQADANAGAFAVPVVSEAVVVEHAHGIHARPAALIARAAKQFPHEIEIRARGRGASARSAVALMSLGVRGGDELVINGFQPAAATGVAAIARVIRELEHVAPAPVPATVVTPAGSEPGRLRGVVASRGYAVGNAFYLQHIDVPVAEYGLGFEQESAAFDHSREEVRARLSRLAATAVPTVREILAAHLELLDDPQLLQDARAAIRQGKSAGFAWRGALRASAAALLSTGDARIGERVDDLRDLEQQVLVALGAAATVKAEVPEGGILVARDLAPSQFIDLDTRKLRGIVLAGGGPTSHVAILAAAAGVPMLVALGPALLEAAPGTPLVLDAENNGALRVAPEESELAGARAKVSEREAARERDRAAAQKDCHLASGERIEVFANLTGTVTDAELAVRQGAEGCGLLRTEFLFLERTSAPTEEEQVSCYRDVARVLGDRPLVIRTMDIGGDKPIPYLPLPPEDNPALGLRGIRTSLWRPDLLETQLRALLRMSKAGAVAGQCRILLPMVTEAGEIRAVRALLQKLRAPDEAMPQLGAMVETPASALLAGQLAAEVDFLSIGTNDLTQYTLAMDRGNAAVAPRVDGLHPAVLRLIEAVGAAGEKHGKLVAVCGGLASDPVAAPLLLGLGVRELSVVPGLIPALKARVSSLTLAQCRSLAARALELDSAEAVRRMAREVLP